MFRRSLTTVLALSLLLLTGCGDSPDKVVTDMISTMKDMNTTLAEVKDVDTAKSAVPKLEKIAQDMKSIQERMDGMEKPDEATIKELEAKYKTQMDEVGKELVANMFRIMSLGPEVEAELDKAFENMGDSDSDGWF